MNVPVYTAGGQSPARQEVSYLEPGHYDLLKELFQVSLNYFLVSPVNTSTGLPLTAYKVGDRARFGYSNPTEWGYAIQAWIAASERGVIPQTEAAAKINKALTTMRSLQQNPAENYQSLFYPFYVLTDGSGSDLSAPVHSINGNAWSMIPSGDLALLYASLLITQGWANYRDLPALSTLAASVKDQMDFRMFLFQENDGMFLAHQVDALTGERSTSRWNIFADEGGVVAWVAYYAGSISFEEYMAVTDAQDRRPASWKSCTGKTYYVPEASWFNAMFTYSVRSLAGFSIGVYDSPPGSLSRYSQDSLVPTVHSHLAFGDCIGVDYPGFSDAMTQAKGGDGIVGYYVPANLPGIVPIDPPTHIMPHAFFVPFNAGPDLPDAVLVRLVTEITELMNDQTGYYHDSGSDSYGFEVVVSPHKDQVSYNGADDGRPIFETLSQAYIVLSLFNALQLQDGKPTFYSFTTNVLGYMDTLREVLLYLYPYPYAFYLPLISKPLISKPLVVRFGSGNSPYPQSQSITFGKNSIHAGENILVLSSANPPDMGRWVFWDSLNVKDEQSRIIWQLGSDEAPPDYTSRAFDEFDNSLPYQGEIFLPADPASSFPAELNDSNLTQVKIHFTLTAAQAQGDITVYLDTLYATHTGAEYFDMQVQLIQGE